MRFHTLMKFTWVNIAWHTIYTCERCENASFESSDFVSSSFSKMPIDMIHLQRLPLPKQRVRATRCPWQCQLCPRSWCCQCHTPVKFNIGKKNVFENSKKKIKCQKQILLSSYGHHYLINQIHPNSNSCFGQKVTSIDKCYMTCFQLIFFSESNPHRHKLPWLGLCFARFSSCCSLSHKVCSAPARPGLQGSREGFFPPNPRSFSREMVCYGCSKQLWLKGSKVSGLHWYAWRCMPCWHVYGNGWGQNFRPAVGRPRWAWLQEHLGLDQNYGHNDSQIWSSLVGKPLILGRIVLITQPGAWAWELISLRCSWRKHGERMFGWCKACFFGLVCFCVLRTMMWLHVAWLVASCFRCLCRNQWANEKHHQKDECSWVKKI